MKGKSRGRKRKSTEPLSSPGTCSTDNTPIGSANVALTQNSCGKFVPKFSKKAKVQKSHPRKNSPVLSDSLLECDEGSSTQPCASLLVELDSNEKGNEVEESSLIENSLVTKETSQSIIRSVSVDNLATVSHDHMSQDHGEYVPGLSLSQGIKKIEFRVQMGINSAELVDSKESNCHPTNDDVTSLMVVPSEKLDSSFDKLKDTVLSGKKSPKPDEGKESSVNLLLGDTNNYQKEKDTLSLVREPEVTTSGGNRETKAENESDETENGACPLGESANESVNPMLEAKSIGEGNESMSFAQIILVQEEPTKEKVETGSQMKASPPPLEDHVTTMREDGLGEVALQQLDDSLSMQDIEEMCLDFEFGGDFSVTETKAVKQLQCAPVKITDDTTKVRSTESHYYNVSKIPTVPSISPRCRVAATYPRIPPIQDHTSALQGLVNELSMLNQYILKCRQELEFTRTGKKITKQVHVWK